MLTRHEATAIRSFVICYLSFVIRPEGPGYLLFAIGLKNRMI